MSIKIKIQARSFSGFSLVYSFNFLMTFG